MNKPPAFQFYAKDWLTDRAVKRMSSAARGVFISLLAYEWVNGPLENDHTELARAADESPREFAKLWPMLAPCFIPHPDNPRQLINPRLESERESQRQFREAQSLRSRAAWGKRKASHRLATGKPMPSSASAYEIRKDRGARAPKAHVPQGPLPCPRCGKLDCLDPFMCAA